MNEPLISICCLVYNHGKYLEKALNSFLMQKTEYKFEIIVHDDASTDDSAAIIMRYYEENPDLIKPILQEENQYSKGIDVLKNFLFAQAKGKYIAFCEGDDFWTDQNKLQKQISYMERHPECTCTFHAVNYIRNNRVDGNDRKSDVETDYSAEEIIAGGGEFCASASLCFQAQYALEYPKFRNISDVGDYPLQILLSLKGKIHYFPQIMGSYRVGHEGSWSTNSNKKNVRIEHLKNEIYWLLELDKETNGKYKYPIYYRIGLYETELFHTSQKGIVKLRDVYLKLKISRYGREVLKKNFEYYLKYKHLNLYENLKRIKHLITKKKGR